MLPATPISMRLAATVALGLSLCSAASAAAQSTSTAPWRAWLGCWSAGESAGPAPGATPPVVCVSPTADANVVQVATVVDGKVQSTQVVDASGREQPLTARGCSGTQSGRWSADGRRVYLRATGTCDGVLRTTAGILALTPTGEWLDIQGTSVGPDESVRIMRYRDVGLRGAVPADMAESLRDMGMSVHAARMAAGATIGTAAVAEAVSATTVGVAEAFVLERAQRFALDARTLVSLADAGVPARITDAMVAASNPRAFAVRGARPVVRDSLDNDIAGRRVYVTLDRYASPWDWGYDPYSVRHGYRYDPYGRYGYGAYGYPGYGYGGGVIIVRGSDDPGPSSHGRMVKGRGYQAAGTGSPTAPQRAATREWHDASPDRGTGSSGASRDGGSGSTSSGSGSSGSSGTSSDRTAKPRP